MLAIEHCLLQIISWKIYMYDSEQRNCLTISYMTKHNNKHPINDYE